MHGFIQEPSVSRQPVTGQQKLKCGILIMNVDGHYTVIVTIDFVIVISDCDVTSLQFIKKQTPDTQ